MSTRKPATPPQSVAFVWIVLVHVLVLPVAAAYLPALLPQPGPNAGSQGYVVAPFLLSGILAVLVIALHFAIWRMARGEGHVGLQYVVAGLGVVSLATLVLLGTAAPLLVLARLAGLVL
ncbi:hypothetical protein [Stappia sp. ES.058]|uniref:hypothetical protein n=1 Tax=Stappia sp. ES.058 TaxID=1881061 RepID=UPI00087D5B2C|nr:hypothetical protein [Stappia sp. ES.058]SDU17042.1 hypothetical protein SAMN05428979_2060 [Stappia sp. ES.058]